MYINKAVDRKSLLFLDNKCTVFFMQGNVINTFMITGNVFPFCLATDLLLDNKCMVLFMQGNIINTFTITKNVYPFCLATSRLSSHSFPSFEYHPVSLHVSFYEILPDSTTTTYFPTCKPSNKTKEEKKNLSIYVSKPSHPTGKFLTVASVLVIIGVTQFLVPQPNLITGLLHIMSETDLISEHHNVIAT